jgi:hypothetical protein
MLEMIVIFTGFIVVVEKSINKQYPADATWRKTTSGEYCASAQYALHLTVTMLTVLLSLMLNSLLISAF